MKWTDIQLSYLAGIIDGEGCFCITKPGNKTHVIRLFVMNTFKPLIDYLYKTYGGFQYSRKKENRTWKIRHEWFVDSQILDELLPLLKPFLINKKKHCDIAITFRKTFLKEKSKYHKVPDHIRLIREQCYIHMKVLNKKGP